MEIIRKLKLFAYFYPRSPCGERLFKILVESQRYNDFYPRSPCGERPHTQKINPASQTFLSTLSLRRATQTGQFVSIRGSYFYPRSPCGERLGGENRTIDIIYFYPRSPCGERRSHYRTSGPLKRFLSTLSLRRATTKSDLGANSQPISIHALLAESDGTKKFKTPVPAYFYPRSPCGERRN